MLREAQDAEEGRRRAPHFKALRAAGRFDLVLAFCAALTALLAYLWTLAPTVTGEDSGELIAAAYTLGIPHPPGYPTWTMLAHVFTWLPFGSVPWRVNLSSAVFAAVTVGLIVPLLRRLGVNRIGAVAGALFFALSREFWEQALIAEVYALNALFFCGLILLLLVWREERKPWQLPLFALLYGLSLGVHNTMHLCAPFFAVFVIAVERPRPRRWLHYLVLAAISLGVAFIVYCYLPLRSLADPAVDWGNPETLENWWAVVSREQYAFMASQYPRSADRFGYQIQMMWGLWTEQFGAGVILVPLGAGVLLWRQRWIAAWLFSLGVFIVVAFVLVQNPQVDKEWRWVMSVFPIPLYLITALCIGAAFDFISHHAVREPKSSPSPASEEPSLSRHLSAWCTLPPHPNPLPREREPDQTFLKKIYANCAEVSDTDSNGWVWGTSRFSQIGTCVFLGFFLVFDLAPAAKELSKGDYYWADDYARNVFTSLEPDALFFGEYDHANFPMLYLQAVEGVRSDVTLGRKYGYLNMDVAPELVAEYGEFPKRRHDPAIIAHVLRNTNRPVYVQSPVRLPMKTVEFAARGLVYRVLRPGEVDAAGDVWSQYRWHTLEVEDARGDFTAELIVAEIAVVKARQAMERGEKDEGAMILWQALTVMGDDYKLLNNAGVLCARFGLREHARMFFELARALDWREGTAQRNLERLGE